MRTASHFAILLLAGTFFAGVANAEDAAPQPSPVASAADAKPVQVAMVMPAPVSVVAPINDGLHADGRWPAMAGCINNTSTPDEFNSCLRNAFMADSTGSELALGRQASLR